MLKLKAAKDEILSLAAFLIMTKLKSKEGEIVVTLMF